MLHHGDTDPARRLLAHQARDEAHKGANNLECQTTDTHMRSHWLTYPLCKDVRDAGVDSELEELLAEGLLQTRVGQSGSKAPIVASVAG